MRLRSRRILVVCALVVAAVLSVALRLRGSQYRHLDGVSGNVLLALVGDETSYAPRYSEAAFAELRVGIAYRRVLDALGEPMWRMWWYPTIAAGPNRCCAVYLDGAAERVLASDFKDVTPGSDGGRVRYLHGGPSEETWAYAGREWSEFAVGYECDHRIRQVTIRDGRLAGVHHEIYIE